MFAGQGKGHVACEPARVTGAGFPADPPRTPRSRAGARPGQASLTGMNGGFPRCFLCMRQFGACAWRAPSHVVIRGPGSSHPVCLSPPLPRLFRSAGGQGKRAIYVEASKGEAPPALHRRHPLARPRRPLSSPAGDAGKCGAAALRGAEGWVRGAQRLPPPSPSSAVSLLARPSLWGGVEVGGAGGEGTPKRGAARQRGAVGGTGRPGPSRQPRERGPRRTDDDGVFPARPEAARASPLSQLVTSGEVAVRGRPAAT